MTNKHRAYRIDDGNCTFESDKPFSMKMYTDPNYPYWQDVPEYLTTERALANNFRFRRHKYVGTEGYAYEMFVSDNALEEIYDWLTARDEAHNNPRM